VTPLLGTGFSKAILNDRTSRFGSGLINGG